MVTQPGLGVVGQPTAVTTSPIVSPPAACAVLAPSLQAAHVTTAKATAATLPNVTRILASFTHTSGVGYEDCAPANLRRQFVFRRSVEIRSVVKLLFSFADK